MSKWIVVAAFVLLALGNIVSLYQNLHWHCWQPGGGEVGAKTSVLFLQDKLNDGHLFYPYQNCSSRFPW